MDVFDAVRTILAVRRYAGKPVPEEIVRRIAEAGRLTASGGNSQPWHFVVVQDRDTLRRLAEVVRTGPYISGAPLTIVVVVDPTHRLAVSDGSRAIQSMMLTAWSEGVGSNWVGFVGGLSGTKAILGVPDELDILAIVPFGYPQQRLGRGKKNRKPLAEVASREQYGEPF